MKGLKKVVMMIGMMGVLSFTPMTGIVFAESSTDADTKANQTVEEVDNAFFEKYPEAKKWQWDEAESNIDIELKTKDDNNITIAPFSKGAVLVTSDALGSSLGSLGHAGISYNSSKNLSSFSTNGVQLYKNSSYGSKYKNWGSAFPGSSFTAADAADEAHQYIGKPYNYNYVNKLTTNSFYCSQLVWRGYQNIGKNLAPGTPFAAPKQLWKNTGELPITVVNHGMPSR